MNCPHYLFICGCLNLACAGDSAAQSHQGSLYSCEGRAVPNVKHMDVAVPSDGRSYGWPANTLSIHRWGREILIGFRDYAYRWKGYWQHTMFCDTVDTNDCRNVLERVGDVLRMMQSARIERASLPERVPCVQMIRGDSGQPYRDNAESGILILGDSFLRIYEQDEPGSAGLIAHLAKELRQPLTSLVNDGGASTLVRQELYRRPALLMNKQVLVWEFVERDIRLGTEGWQQVPLPSLASADVRSSGRESAPLSLNQSRPTSAVAGE